MLTCQDNLSKYLLAIPMMTQTAEEVALNFMRYVVLQYGIPCSIVTDQGTQFMGDVLRRLCKLLKVHKINTSACRPESNGALERTHKTTIEYLRCFCNPRGTDWNKWLPFSCFVYNTTPHTMTKFTPYVYTLCLHPMTYCSVERPMCQGSYSRGLQLCTIMMI